MTSKPKTKTQPPKQTNPRPICHHHQETTHSNVQFAFSSSTAHRSCGGAFESRPDSATLNHEPAEGSAVEASVTLDMYTITGPLLEGNDLD